MSAKIRKKSADFENSHDPRPGHRLLLARLISLPSVRRFRRDRSEAAMNNELHHALQFFGVMLLAVAAVSLASNKGVGLGIALAVIGVGLLAWRWFLRRQHKGE